ncbi:MAG TPA: glycosyltransferase, partial [Ilumatobacteraceae bacterium]|nr:glycosyltransferase [Ilumatobacteraceae bacterium]
MPSTSPSSLSTPPGSLEEPLVTVAIPYYANLAYLAEALASVQAQSDQRWRALVVDDAGPEPATDLVAALDDARIGVVRNAVNLGLAGNWNRCIALATTPWVTLLHADDRLHRDYVGAVLAAIEQHPDVTAVFTDAAVIGDYGQPRRSLPEFVKRFARRPGVDHRVEGDRSLASILSNNYVMCPTLTYCTEPARALLFDERWSMVMDLDHTASMLLDGQAMWAIRRPLYEYRRHAANTTN